MTRENCEGFQVYDGSHFYAISNAAFRDAFNDDQDKVKLIFKLIENSTLVHMSNTLSRRHTVLVGSKKAYALLAEIYCPRVYEQLGYFF